MKELANVDDDSPVRRGVKDLALFARKKKTLVEKFREAPKNNHSS